MVRDDSMNEGETNARAAPLGGEEWFDQGFSVLGRETDAGVFDLDDHIPVSDKGCDLNATATGNCPHSVVEQVDQGLPQKGGIDQGPDLVLRELGPYVETLTNTVIQRTQLSQDAPQICRLWVDSWHSRVLLECVHQLLEA